MSGGWIKIERSMFEDSVWVNSTPEQKVILVTLLEMANYCDKEWEWQGKRFTCKRGQMVTSLQSIADRSGRGVTIRNVRTALQRFENLGFLTNKSTKTGRLITIVKYGEERCDGEQTDKQTDNQLTKHRQSTDNQLTPKEEKKKNKEEKEVMAEAEIIIEHLNQRAGTNYKATTRSTLQAISGRLNDGYMVQDFIEVIDKKSAEWIGTEYERYLTPRTLFRPANFEAYVNQRITKAKPKQGDALRQAYIDEMQEGADYGGTYND